MFPVLKCDQLLGISIKAPYVLKSTVVLYPIERTNTAQQYFRRGRGGGLYDFRNEDLNYVIYPKMRRMVAHARNDCFSISYIGDTQGEI